MTLETNTCPNCEAGFHWANADFLVTEENVHTALVYGIVHDEDGIFRYQRNFDTVNLTSFNDADGLFRN